MKMFIPLTLLFSWFWFAQAEIRLTAQDAIASLQGLHSLPENQIVTAESRFFSRWGTPRHIDGFFPRGWSYEQRPKKTGTVNGLCARLLYGAGTENTGIYFYSPSEDDHRVVKILNGEVSDASQLLGAFLGESVGGAKVLGFGSAFIANNETAHYIEMEELFPNDQFKNYKYDLKGSLVRAARYQENGTPVVLAIADLLADTLEKSIVPYDPDFLITKKGQVRWLDTMHWRQPGKRELFEGFTDVITSFMPVKSGPDFKYSNTNAKIYREFFVQFLKRIKRSTILESKLFFLITLFRDNKHIVGSSTFKPGDFGTMAEILHRAGIASSPTETNDEAFAELIELYHSL